MADAYESLNRSRAALYGNVTKALTALNKFDPAKDSVNVLKQWKKNLDKSEKGHEDVIERMLSHPDADEDSIYDNSGKFFDAFTTASILLNDLMEALPKHRPNQQLVKDEIDAILLTVHEAERFKTSYAEEDVSVAELRMREAAVVPLQRKFASVVDQYFPGASEDLKTYLNAQHTAFSASVFAINAWLSEEIARRAPPPPPVAAPARHTPGADNSLGSAKLPKLDLPKFDGSYEKWVPFRDCFVSLIHNNAKLPAVAKFRYLKTSVTDINSPINHMLETEEGYADAWKTIMDFYDDKRKILDGHFGHMMTAKRMTSESHDELQKILNEFNLHSSSIERMFSKEELYDSFIAHLVIFRLDQHTRDLFETENKNQIPSWPELKKFLENRRKTLSTLPSKVFAKPNVAVKAGTSKYAAKTSSAHAMTSSTTSTSSQPSSSNSTANRSSTRSQPIQLKCRVCSGEHKIHACSELNRLSVPQRFAKVRDLKLCENCLSPNHALVDCPSKFSCQHCRMKHHSMLHQHLDLNAPPFQTNASCNAMASVSRAITLLQTAYVKIRDAHGKWRTVRAFLDSGSESNFISTEVATALNLKLHSTEVEVNGLGGNRLSTIRHFARAGISNDETSHDDLELEFLVTNKVTNPSPIAAVDRSLLNIPENILLADPTFDVPGKIDILLGNQVYGKLLRTGRYELTSDIVLLNTMFGFVFSGRASPSAANRRTIRTACNHSRLEELKESIEKFWVQEEYRQGKKFLTPEQAFCEENFEQTHFRGPDGVFVVQTPFNEKLKLLEPNNKAVFCKFLSTEKRLQKNPLLSEAYNDVIKGYEDLGHMDEVNAAEDPPGLQTCYLPHHGVEKPDSTTTALRVVFDPSAKTSSGVSLNDAQCVGPNVQTDAFSLGLRFRQHPVAIKADITKMYRCVKIAPHHRHFQRIFWRKTSTEPVKTYELNTVTFGMASAAYLATRSLRQAGLDALKTHPRGAREIIDNFYVDDWLSGAPTPAKALELAREVVEILEGAGMKLRKFSSNDQDFIEAIPAADRETVDEGKTLKALGIRWNERDDTFGFDVKPIPHQKMTKRLALAEMSRIYDPDGMLGPVLFNFKNFMKQVHQLKTSWDAPLPERYENEWKLLAGTFDLLKNIKIPRHFLINSPETIQLHGFCDSSDKGFGASVYILSSDSGGNRRSHLVCAKSRIAPTAYRSTARLELCGAVLLANLMKRVEEALSVKIDKRFCWSDSAIVLHWIKKLPAQLQEFVANRVNEIQELTGGMTWRHIRSGDNPADLISRGVLPNDLVDNSLWWHGPAFLTLHETQWPTPLIELNPDEPAYRDEFKRNVANVHVNSIASTPDSNIFLKWMEDSSRTFRVKWKLAYLMRFVHNVRAKKSGKIRREGVIQVDDLIDAEHACIRICQQIHFREESKILQAGKIISSTSQLKMLSPFWDPDLKLIRVGGRIDHGEYTEDQKHPVVLPNCHFTKLMIRETHERSLHAGQLATLSIFRQRFWPIQGRRITKQQIHSCILCFRARPKMVSQFMGSLPSSRVTPAPAFFHTGVDFCGPFTTKVSTLRNAKTENSYVALFVCLATKAIHLEVVSRLSTEAFLSAFDKFASRRGLPRTVHSDNGTNLVGASNQLKEFYRTIRDSPTDSKFRQYFLDNEVEWHFIPPRAPQFGGLWEAGVKSFKHHLTRVAGNSHLSFEEFYQLTCKIEAILNSRPLTSLSEDPNDCAALTAGHFLIGRPLISKPERDISDQNINRLKRWQRITLMQQHFWKRWSQEYVHQLQIRTKNYGDNIPIVVGQLVLMEIENSPPMKWPLGRIEAIYPGKDGITRVASIKTSNSATNYERPVTKLALLPIEPEETSI